MLTTRAAHDLNNVTSLEIIGWSGHHEVAQADGAWVQIEAPQRHESEYWTFARRVDGVLRCHTNLLGSPSLLTDGNGPMVIRLPADKHDLNIRFVP